MVCTKIWKNEKLARHSKGEVVYIYVRKNLLTTFILHQGGSKIIKHYPLGGGIGYNFILLLPGILWPRLCLVLVKGFLSVFNL